VQVVVVTPVAPRAAGADPARHRTVRIAEPLDLRATVGGLSRGRGDPCTKMGADHLWWATNTPLGPATLHVSLDPARAEAHAEAWGAGAEWVLDAVPDLLGVDDDITVFEDLVAASSARGMDLVRELHRRHPGVRMSRSGAAVEALVPSILEQKVISADARASYRGLVRRHGSPAPGPFGLDLMVPPTAATIARLPYWVFHPLNVERRRADTVRRACAVAHRLAVGDRADDDELRRRLLTLPGIGPWTVAEVSRVALGDADAVSVGDYHLCHQVAFALLGERRGTDELMLELLEPFRPHRQRAIRLLLRGTPGPPRRGPRLARSRIRAY
jgi:3-methyladenine DNA glycosylase/8-oxoguanine DNA glycosylase